MNNEQGVAGAYQALQVGNRLLATTTVQHIQGNSLWYLCRSLLCNDRVQ